MPFETAARVMTPSGDGVAGVLKTCTCWRITCAVLTSVVANTRMVSVPAGGV